METVQGLKRTNYCGELREADAGRAVTLFGWVQRQRAALSCYASDGSALGSCIYYIPLYPAGSCTGTLDDFARFVRDDDFTEQRVEENSAHEPPDNSAQV